MSDEHPSIDEQIEAQLGHLRPQPIKNRVEVMPLATLKPYPGNARRHDIDAIRESLRKLGQYRPIIARLSDLTILAGHGTVEAMVAEGMLHGHVQLVDVSDEDARRIVLVDNRANDLASYDHNELLALLEGVDDLDGTGYTAEDVTELSERLEAGEPEDDDTAAAGTPDIYAVAVPCQSEDDRDALISRLEEWGYTPRAVSGKWAGE